MDTLSELKVWLKSARDAQDALINSPVEDKLIRRMHELNEQKAASRRFFEGGDRPYIGNEQRDINLINGILDKIEELEAKQ